MRAAREFDKNLESTQVLAKLEEIERDLRRIGLAFARDINIASNRDQKLQDKIFYIAYYLRYAEFARKILRRDNITWDLAADHQDKIPAIEAKIRAELSDVLGLDLRARLDTTAQAKITTLYNNYLKTYLEERTRSDVRNKADHLRFLEDYYHAFDADLDPAVKNCAAEDAPRREEERRRQEELARKRAADEEERRRREAEEAARLRAAEEERRRREAAALPPPAVPVDALPPVAPVPPPPRDRLQVEDNPPRDAEQRNPAGLAVDMPLEARVVQAAVEALRVYHGQDFMLQEQGSRTIVQLTTNRNPNPRQQLVIDAQAGTIESAKSDTEAIEVMVRAAEAMSNANPNIAFRVQCENESIRNEIISELQKKGINCIVPQPQPVAAPQARP